jgi:hypothetical protein
MPGTAIGLIRARRTVSMTTGQDTYSMTNLYAAGNVTQAYPNNRYLPSDVAGLSTFQFSVGTSGTVTVTSGGLTLYGTNDPVTAFGNGTGTGGVWFALVAPSGATESAGANANPITDFTGDGAQSLTYRGNILAWRAVAPAFTGGGSIVLYMQAGP